MPTFFSLLKNVVPKLDSLELINFAVVILKTWEVVSLGFRMWIRFLFKKLINLKLFKETFRENNWIYFMGLGCNIISCRTEEKFIWNNCWFQLSFEFLICLKINFCNFYVSYWVLSRVYHEVKNYFIGSFLFPFSANLKDWFSGWKEFL